MVLLFKISCTELCDVITSSGYRNKLRLKLLLMAMETNYTAWFLKEISWRQKIYKTPDATFPSILSRKKGRKHLRNFGNNISTRCDNQKSTGVRVTVIMSRYISQKHVEWLVSTRSYKTSKKYVTAWTILNQMKYQKCIMHNKFISLTTFCQLRRFTGHTCRA